MNDETKSTEPALILIDSLPGEEILIHLSLCTSLKNPLQYLHLLKTYTFFFPSLLIERYKTAIITTNSSWNAKRKEELSTLHRLDTFSILIYL